jgi:hypothetical protein
MEVHDLTNEKWIQASKEDLAPYSSEAWGVITDFHSHKRRIFAEEIGEQNLQLHWKDDSALNILLKIE